MGNYLHRKQVVGETFSFGNGVTWPWKVTTNVSESGWDEDSTIENWNYISDKLFTGTILLETNRDYKYIRDQIKNCVEKLATDATLGTETDDRNVVSPDTGDTYLVGASPIKGFRYEGGKIAVWDGSKWIFKFKDTCGFDLATSDEKAICLTHKIGSHSQRLTQAGSELELIKKGLEYHSRISGINVKAPRQIREGYGISAVHNRTEQIRVEINISTLALEDNSALTVTNTPPSTPDTGDTVIVGNDGTGDFDGNEKDVATWNGASWDFRQRYWISVPELMLSQIDPYNYIYKYRELGLGGLVDGDNAAGLLDYFNGTVGTIWGATGGVRGLGSIITELPEGLASWSDFADELLAIMKDGIY